MNDTPLLRTGTAGLVRLSAYGRTAVSAYRQLTGIVAERLGQRHAAYLARPEIRSEEIVWFCLAGEAVPVTALPHDRLVAIEAESARLAADIAALADSLKTEGGSHTLLGFLLDLALITPAGSISLYAVGNQPVLVRWGHLSEGEENPCPLPSPTPEPAAGRRRFRWPGWLPPTTLAVLLIVLSIKACTPLPPVVVETAEPSPPPVDPIPDLEKRRQELRDRLTNLERDAREATARCLVPLKKTGGEP